MVRGVLRSDVGYLRRGQMQEGREGCSTDGPGRNPRVLLASPLAAILRVDPTIRHGGRAQLRQLPNEEREGLQQEEPA